MFKHAVRRVLVVLVVGLTVLAPTPMRRAAAVSRVLTHGPVVGAVTDTQARVFVRTDRDAEVRLRYGRARDLNDGIDSDAQQTSGEHDWTAILPLANLQPDTVYFLDVLVDGVPQLKRPYPRFKTFPPQGTPTSFKFLILTDFGENGSSQPTVPGFFPTFENANQEQPDFVIIGGDFGHNNEKTLKGKRDQFKRLYQLHSPAGLYDPFVKKILRRYPVAHMWDDHDYGKNNSDKTYPGKALTYRVFNEFFPAYELPPLGDWQRFSYAQADFFLLDERSQRDPNDEKDGPSKSMLDGDELGATGQLEWLKQGLLDSKAVWKFIVTPVPFNPTLKKPDSWRRFRHERGKLLRFIRENSISGVILLSGDAHMGGLDDGTHAGLPEMLTPGPNLLYCATVSRPGVWSEGIYWTHSKGPSCNGYGVVSVQADAPLVNLQVKDMFGNTRLELNVSP